jgi:hypothetical protein
VFVAGWVTGGHAKPQAFTDNQRLAYGHTGTDVTSHAPQFTANGLLPRLLREHPDGFAVRTLPWRLGEAGTCKVPPRRLKPAFQTCVANPPSRPSSQTCHAALPRAVCRSTVPIVRARPEKAWKFAQPRSVMNRYSLLNRVRREGTCAEYGRTAQRRAVHRNSSRYSRTARVDGSQRESIMTSNRHSRNPQHMRALIENMGRSIDEARNRRLGPVASAETMSTSAAPMSSHASSMPSGVANGTHAARLSDMRYPTSQSQTSPSQSNLGSPERGDSMSQNAGSNGHLQNPPPVRAANEMFDGGTPRLKARPKRAS